jgi:hypothetical protein
MIWQTQRTQNNKTRTESSPSNTKSQLCVRTGRERDAYWGCEVERDGRGSRYSSQNNPASPDPEERFAHISGRRRLAVTGY